MMHPLTWSLSSASTCVDLDVDVGLDGDLYVEFGGLALTMIARNSTGSAVDIQAC